MTLDLINQITDLIMRIGGVLIGAITCAWAVNKMWLSSIYVSKTEAKQMISENENLIKSVAENNNKTSQELHTLKQDFAVFQERYEGHSALTSEKLTTIRETNKDILHRVNNMANVDHRKLIEDVIDDKLEFLKDFIKSKNETN